LTIVKIRSSEITNCLEQTIISPLRGKVFRDFDVKYKKAGRSGGHGKKFNILSMELISLSNNTSYIKGNECSEGIEERKFVIKSLKKRAKQFQEKANGINHLSNRK